MKKYFLFAASAIFLATATIATSCGSDDDTDDEIIPTVQNLVTKVLSVENAKVMQGNIPSATISNPGITINTNSSALAGGGDILNIVSPEPLKALHISVEGLKGYLECTPKLVTSRATSTADIYEYVVEVMYDMGLSTDIQINVNVVTEDGGIVSLLRQKAIEYVESQKGDLAINLVFDQAKDVDLHLITPNGQHIYYGNPSISFEYDESAMEAFMRRYYAKMEELAKKYGLKYSDGEVWYENYSDYDKYLAYCNEMEAWIEANSPYATNGAGLDHDSNAGCEIDNLNNENIVLNAEYLTPGTYRVLINMWENCSPKNRETNWTVMARIGDRLITPTSGKNPCSGQFETYAYSNDYDDISKMTEAMTFTLTQAQIDALKPARVQGKKPVGIYRAPLSDRAVMKLMDANHFTPEFVPAPVRRLK